MASVPPVHNTRNLVVGATGPAGLYSRGDGYSNTLILAASTAKSDTIPDGATYVEFRATADFWVLFDGTAEIPAGDIQTGTSALLSPAGLTIEGNTTISVISATANNYVNLVYYAAP